MPSRCCVPLCKGNYPTGPKVSVFKFPKDEDTIQKWLHAIQRKNFYPSKSSRVCELHFESSDIIRENSTFDSKTGNEVSVPLQTKRLKKEAIPTIFENYPASNAVNVPHLRKNPEERKVQKEMLQLQEAIASSVESHLNYNTERRIENIEDVKNCVKKFQIPPFWTIHNVPDSESLYFLHIESHPAPYIQYSLKIDENLHVSMAVEKNIISNFLNYSFPFHVSHFNEILNILDLVEGNQKKNNVSKVKSVILTVNDLLQSISSKENEIIIKFIQEQLGFFLSKNKNYSPELLVFSALFQSISPHAYRFVRQSGNVILPHPETLKRICNNLCISPDLELVEENFLMYISNRINYLQNYEKCVILLLDEVHIKPFFDYKGGSIVGAAYDSNKVANSAYVFMISSVLSSFKEVVHIIPVHSINYEKLHNIIKKVITGLEKIGLRVIGMVTDNNSINAKALSLFMKSPERSFVYPHPVDAVRPLFYLIDSVHIFKCIRNNWLNQKNSGTCFFFPDFDNPCNGHINTASFYSLKILHEIETNQIIKYATGLTLKSLSPSNLERQNVRLVLKVFNKFVIQGLLNLGPIHNIPHFQETADFIAIICKWWDIFNVRTTTKGIHQRNVFMAPLNADENDEKTIFLKKFLFWLDAWDNMKCSTGSLSRETHKALLQTTHGMLEFTNYCIDECNMRYVLTGKIQTDCLEERFGKYRQLSGSQYDISIRQLLEGEKKLRLQSSIKLELLVKSSKIELIDFSHNHDLDNTKSDGNYLQEHGITFSETELSSAEKYIPVLTYVGGYCSYSVLKKIKCNECVENLTLSLKVNLDSRYNLIKNLDQGGLKCPTQFVVNVVLYNYIVVNKLYSESENFLQKPNQKSVVIDLTYNLLKSREIILENACENGHDGDSICKLILGVSTNIMLKNLCCEKNDVLSKRGKKRKLQTLSKK